MLGADGWNAQFNPKNTHGTYDHESLVVGNDHRACLFEQREAVANSNSRGVD